MVESRRLVKQLKALADEKRLQIVRLLSKRSICVSELESLLKLTQPAVSHHLKILKEAEVLIDTRQGKWMFYSLNEDTYAEMLNALTVLPSTLAEERILDSEIDFCLTYKQKKHSKN